MICNEVIVDLFDRRVRCVVEGVVARYSVVGQREWFPADWLTDLTDWSAGRAILGIGRGWGFASEWNQSRIKLRAICVICVVWQKERKSRHLEFSM